MEDIKNNIAKNVSTHRKRLNLTQLQLAEKLNYSDKAVSKWERAEAVPDIYILSELAELFGVTVDDLIKPEVYIPPKKKGLPLTVRNKVVIALLSIGVVWLVATALFTILNWTSVPGRLWLAFIYAIPASAIVGIVFNVLWGKRIITNLLISMLIWTLALSFLLTFTQTDVWLVFIVCIPLQVLTILWFFLKNDK